MWPRACLFCGEGGLSALLSRADLGPNDLLGLTLDLTVAAAIGVASRRDILYVELFDVPTLFAATKMKLQVFRVKK